MRNFSDKLIFVLGIFLIGPICCVIAWFDHNNGKGFKTNFKTVFALGKWCKFNYTSNNNNKEKDNK